MGLGGGFLMTIYDAKTGKTTFLDAKEQAPSNATEDMFKNFPDAACPSKLNCNPNQ